MEAFIYLLFAEDVSFQNNCNCSYAKNIKQ